MNLNNTRSALVMLCLAAVFLSGCSTLRGALTDTPVELLPPAEKPAGALAQVDGGGIELIGTQGGTFQVLPVENEGAALPDIRINRVSFSNASVFDVMRTLLSGTNISFTIVNDTPNSAVQLASISAVNMSGKLSDIMRALSRSSGFYYTYRDGILAVYPDRQYIIDLPPVDELMESMQGMIKQLGATQVNLDRPGKMISFRASRSNYERIVNYVEHMRSTRSVIVYDSVIWEVVLSDGKQQAIDWNKFQWKNSQTGSTYGVTNNNGLAGAASQILPVTGGLGFAAIFNGSRISMDVIASFLETQGTLRTVSQPKISMVSGGKAMWRVGNTTTFVSKVGATTGTSVTQTTVETEKLLTGLDMLINGDVYDGTVFTDIRLKLNELLRLDIYTALGTQLKLPQTAIRELETMVRARPGDSIMLAGINIDKSALDVAGIFGKESVVVPMSDAQSKSRSELIIVMRPRLIKFVTAPSAPSIPAVTGEASK